MINIIKEDNVTLLEHVDDIFKCFLVECHNDIFIVKGRFKTYLILWRRINDN